MIAGLFFWVTFLGHFCRTPLLDTSHSASDYITATCNDDMRHTKRHGSLFFRHLCWSLFRTLLSDTFVGYFPTELLTLSWLPKTIICGTLKDTGLFFGSLFWVTFVGHLAGYFHTVFLTISRLPATMICGTLKDTGLFFGSLLLVIFSEHFCRTLLYS